MISICSAIVLGAAAPAVAQPVVPVSPGQVQIRFDEIGDPRSEAGAVNLSLIKLGQLQSSPGSVLADGSVCPEAERLAPTGITFVCANHKEIQKWVKDCYDGKENVRKSGSIIYLDREGNEVLRTYNLFECFATSLRKYEGGDCDDTDPTIDLIEVDVICSAIRAVGKHKGDYLPAHNKFKLEIGACMPGVACPDADTDGVSGLEIKYDASCLGKGGQPSTIACSTGFSIVVGEDDDCDGLFEMMLKGQGKTSPPSPMRATINTTRSNIKHNKSVTLPQTVLNIEGAQIQSVTLPTFQVVEKPTDRIGHGLDYLEVRVDRIEMK